MLNILQDEVDGNVRAALKKMTTDYSMTWVYAKGKALFPTTKRKLKDELEEVYFIKGRQYDVRNVAEGNNVVMIELIESYPDPRSRRIFRTPLVLVLEMKGGKIRTGRHYLDPRLSGMFLTKMKVDKAYKNSGGAKLIIC